MPAKLIRLRGLCVTSEASLCRVLTQRRCSALPTQATRKGRSSTPTGSHVIHHCHSSFCARRRNTHTGFAATNTQVLLIAMLSRTTSKRTQVITGTHPPASPGTAAPLPLSRQLSRAALCACRYAAHGFICWSEPARSQSRSQATFQRKHARVGEPVITCV